MDVQVSVPPPPPPPPPPAFFAETTAPASPAQPVTTTTTTVNVASPPTQDRIWLHPWTVTEMRENASQWSLAGDAGVLLYLEQFSDRLTQRADAIQQHISQTVNAVKSTHTRVLNCLNEFTSLANTQFIENRVYDEDETADSTSNTSKKDEQNEKGNLNNTEAQEKVLQRYVEAIQYGLAILDTHFERVEAKLDNNANGGSAFVDDEEDGGISLEPILEPKDPYIFRPLPYLIGTTDFMQDDYVGLGDLLIVPDEETYGVEQIEKIESDSAGSGSDEEYGAEDDKDFEVQITPVSIIPAGASRAEVANRPPPTETFLTDSEDDDDPFGLGKKNITKIDSSSSKPAPKDDDSFDDEPKKPPLKPEKLSAFDSEDEEDNDTFGLPIKPRQSSISKQDADDDFDDKSSTSSKEAEAPEPPKPKVMSELEKAVLRRRRAIGDPDAPPENDDDDDDSNKKPTPTKTKTSSNEPSSSVISNLTSQPLTTPSKISKPSIFGDDDDDDDDIDIFNPKPKLPTVLPSPVTITETKPSQKKEKDFFDDDSDDGDIFSPKPKTPVSSSIPAKKNDPIPTPQLTVLVKPKPIPVNVSDDDDFFGEKPTPIVTKPAALKKQESSQSDEDMFTPSTSKPLQLPTKTKTAPISDDEDPLPISQPSVSKTTPPPVVLPPVKTFVVKNNDDSEDEIFGLSKKPPSAATTPLPLRTPTAVPSAKSNDEEDEKDLFGKTITTTTTTTTTKPKVPTVISKPQPPISSDEDENLFSSKPFQVKLPPPVVLPPLPSPPNVKSDVHDDPLGIRKSVESTPQPSPVVQPAKTSSIPIKKTLSSDEDDENSPPTRVLNPGAVKDGEKINVKDITSRLKINPGAFKPGGFKPNARPKSDSITEEPPKPSVEDDDQPIEKNEPAPTIVKKPLTIISDSDDDDLFIDQKKKKIETPKTPVVEQKEKTTNENQNGKTNVKDLSSRLKFSPMMPGAQPKPIPKESNNNTEATSNEEPVVDKTMNSILRDRAKGPTRTRAAPSRNLRVAVADASTNDDDTFFSTPKPTNKTTSSPASTAVPKLPSPAPANVPIASPPSVVAPVTGLPDKPAAIAAKQTNLKEKKKFSLFNSDDSDIDELLFGSNTKKTKSSVTQKTSTTTKSSAKASILPLDDDDDFLSKRPVKKTTKQVIDVDDIFADPKSKPKKEWPTLSKPDETDTFNDASTKSSNTSKSKATPAKNKTTKSFDIFDDPLDVSSKR